MAWLLSYVWTPELDAELEKDAVDGDAVLIQNEDDKWVIEPAVSTFRDGLPEPIQSVKAGLAHVKSRHEIPVRTKRKYALRFNVPPVPARIKRAVVARNTGREQMRGQAGAGGGKWASSR